MNITYLPYSHIDFIKWDNCIAQASNETVYAYSYYLNHMTIHWDALVANDYEFIMPLTYNKKYGIYYLYQPPFCAQLGVFGNNITSKILEAFIQAIPLKFKYCDIYLNNENVFTIPNIYNRINYILDLNKPYNIIYDAFRENIKRNIKKCKQLNTEVKKDIAINCIIELAKEQNATFSNLSNNNYQSLEQLFMYLKKQNKAITYGIYLQEKLLASAAFFFSGNRAYYILVGNSPDGKTLGASHALINTFIEDHANQNLILDFEGSDISSLAFFYSSFGAIEEKYSALKFNKLPWFVKWLKT
ncbi:MAG: GNAT family N-acetyltransferase [Ferruginibacter sp.]|nr:GNAT family N-acetyltransferase [Ferruginibacter sp.]